LIKAWSSFFFFLNRWIKHGRVWRRLLRELSRISFMGISSFLPFFSYDASASGPTSCKLLVSCERLFSSSSSFFVHLLKIFDGSGWDWSFCQGLSRLRFFWNLYPRRSLVLKLPTLPGYLLFLSLFYLLLVE